MSVNECLNSLGTHYPSDWGKCYLSGRWRHLFLLQQTHTHWVLNKYMLNAHLSWWFIVPLSWTSIKLYAASLLVVSRRIGTLVLVPINSQNLVPSPTGVVVVCYCFLWSFSAVVLLFLLMSCLYCDCLHLTNSQKYLFWLSLSFVIDFLFFFLIIVKVTSFFLLTHVPVSDIGGHLYWSLLRWERSDVGHANPLQEAQVGVGAHGVVALVACSGAHFFF